MADSKITALTSIGTITDPAVDPLVIVDVSDTSMAATGTTKKVTLNNLLACSPTATLASATITGDLTVDTSTLKVDSANNRVGIGTASPTAALHVSSSGSIHMNQRTGNNGCFTQYVDPTSSNYVGTDSGNFRIANNSSQDLLNIQQLGVFAFGDGAGGTRMTLNSTGLGVGGSPLDKFTVVGNSFLRGAAAGVRIGDGGGYGFISAYDQTLSTAKDLVLQTGGGNVGVGVTPSAWGSITALEFKNGVSVGGWSASSSPQLFLTTNSYYNGTNFIYKNSAVATYYTQDAGAHKWFRSTDATPTAGNAITFTQAMTLDASGRLLVGQTSAGLTNADSITLEAGSVGGGAYCVINHKSGTASGQQYAFFGYNGVKTGDITQNGTTGVLYNTVSDYRLKESVQPLIGGLARINALKPSIYKWKSDGSSGEGFLAHELAEVVPFAVTGEKDAVNEDGTIKTQGIDMSRIVPILVAAIKELSAEVNALKNA